MDGQTISNAIVANRPHAAQANNGNNIANVFIFRQKNIHCLHKAMVRRHFDYAHLVWHPSLNKKNIEIEIVQRRATKNFKCLAYAKF